jgi:hypothetical protein
MNNPNDVVTLRQQLRDAGADLDRFEIVVRGLHGDDAVAWARAGVSWFLTRLGPNQLRFSEVPDTVAAGPLALE